MLPDHLMTAHPLLVHFPIALLVLGTVGEILAALLPRWKQLQALAGALVTIGALSLIPTYLTGRQAADALSSPFPRTELAVATHSDWAWWTLWFFVALAVVRLGMQWRKRLTGKTRWGMAAASLVGLFLIYETAEHGGELVYDLGAGVRPVREAPEGAFDPPVEPDLTELGPTFGDDGSLRWRFRPGAEKALGAHIDVLLGTLPTAAVEARESALILDVDSSTARLLTLGPSLENLTMSVRLDTREFRGVFALVHHVNSPRDFDFLRLRDGRLELGRRRGGADTVLDDASAPTFDGFYELRAVGATTHVRGYVDGQLVVHGHGAALPVGPVGLFIEGEGRLRIDDLRVQPLRE